MRKNIFVIEGALAAATAIALSFTATYTNDNSSSVKSETIRSTATVEEMTAVGVAGMFRDIELQAALRADGVLSLETGEFTYVTAAIAAAEAGDDSAELADASQTDSEDFEAVGNTDKTATDEDAAENTSEIATDTEAAVGNTAEEAATGTDSTEEVITGTTDAVTTIVSTLTEEEQEWIGYLMPNVKKVLNVRASADEDSELVGKLYKGDRAVIVEKGAEWTKITSGNVEGYVKNSYCYFGLEALSYARANCDVIAKATIDGLRVRKEASTDADVCGKLDEGTKLTVVKSAKTADGWVAVSYKGATCYVSADYVTVSMKLGTGVTIEEEKAAEEAKKAESVKSSSKKSSSGNISELAYEADDVTLLAALIDCEAGGQEYEALLAVGACVMNRVKSSSYPNTIFDVIHQKGQFPPATSGSLERRLKNGPSKSAIKAAKAAIAGEDNIDGRLGFQMASTGHSGIVIGDNVFY